MEDPSHVLVVDPDLESRRRIVQSLETRSFRCHETASAAAAMDFVREKRPDLILLDTVLPDVSGLGLCRMLRESSDGGRIPIVVVSAHSSEVDRLLAFEAGADDFLAKPFYAAELSARVAAVLRGFAERPGDVRAPVRETGMLQVNLENGVAALHGRRLDLTSKEFEILVTLMSQPGRVMKREQLVARVWGGNAPQSDRAVDAHIKSIRRKLGEARRCIETVRGVGYRFCEH